MAHGGADNAAGRAFFTTSTRSARNPIAPRSFVSTTCQRERTAMSRRLGTCRHGRAIAAGLIVFASAAVSPPARADQPVLRVCASEDSLPFSNRAQEGYENKIA